MSDATATRVKASAGAVVLGFAVIYIVWGSTYLAIRWGVETIPPFLMGGARFVVAGVLLHAFLRVYGAAAPTWRQVRDNALVGVLLLLGGNGLVCWGEQYVTSGITALVVGTTPLWFVIFDWMLPPRNRPTVWTIVGLALGMGGVVLLGQHGGEDGRPLHLGGTLAILAACMSWGLGSLISKKSKSGADPFMASSLQMIAGGLSQFVVATVLGEWGKLNFAAISLRSGLSWVYLVVIGSLVAFSTYVWLLRVSTPARVSTYAYVNPVIAVLLGWWLAHETLTVRTLGAAAVVVLAVVIITRSRR